MSVLFLCVKYFFEGESLLFVCCLIVLMSKNLCVFWFTPGLVPRLCFAIC